MTHRTTRKPLASALILTVGLCLGACASTGADYTPIVDGTKSASFDSDLLECQELARTREYDNADTKSDAAVGAGVGTVIGALNGSLAEAAAGAVIGGVFGAGEGALETRGERKEIVKACMTNRDHNVVG